MRQSAIPQQYAGMQLRSGYGQQPIIIQVTPQQAQQAQRQQPSIFGNLGNKAGQYAGKKAGKWALKQAGFDLGKDATATAASSAAKSSSLAAPEVLSAKAVKGGGSAATNAAAGAATKGAASSGWSLGGVGSAGNYIAPAAGAYGMYDVFANERGGGRGALQGAASGAAMGSFFGPVGMGVGALVGAGAGYFGDAFATDRFKTEGDRMRKLQERGINIPDQLALPMHLQEGRPAETQVRNDLPASYVGMTPEGTWQNNPWLLSGGDESLLKPQDTWGYSAWMDKFGNDYLQTFNEQDRHEINKVALDAGAIDEYTGTIDVDWTNPAVAAKVAELQNKYGLTEEEKKKAAQLKTSISKDTGPAIDWSRLGASNLGLPVG